MFSRKQRAMEGSAVVAAIPKSLLWTPPSPLSEVEGNRLLRLSPQSGAATVASGGASIDFVLPRTPNSAIESIWVQCDVVDATGGAEGVAYTAASLFDRVLITTPSGVVEDAQHYARLTSVLQTFVSEDWLMFPGKVTQNTSVDPYLAEAAGGPAYIRGASRTFFFPLYLFLTHWCKRALPMYAMSEDITIRLTTSQTALAGYKRQNDNNALAWTLNNVYMWVAQLQVSENLVRAHRALAQSQGGLEMVGTRWSAYTGNIVAAQAFQTVPVPFRGDVHAVVFGMMATAQNADNRRAINRVAIRNNLVQYQLRLGSQLFPQNPVRFAATSMALPYAMLHSVFASMSDTLRNPSINFVQYATAANADYVVNTKTFFGVDLRKLPGTWADQGLNALGADSLDLLLEFDANNAAATMFLFVLHSTRTVITPDGVMRTYN
jgi:hypothetical protein